MGRAKVRQAGMRECSVDPCKHSEVSRDLSYRRAVRWWALTPFVRADDEQIASIPSKLQLSRASFFVLFVLYYLSLQIVHNEMLLFDYDDFLRQGRDLFEVRRSSNQLLHVLLTRIYRSKQRADEFPFFLLKWAIWKGKRKRTRMSTFTTFSFSFCFCSTCGHESASEREVSISFQWLWTSEVKCGARGARSWSNTNIDLRNVDDSSLAD